MTKGRERGWKALVTLVLLGTLVAAQTARAEGVPALPERYLFDSWQRDQGLPQISVLAIAQDPLGYLWLGTEEGLVRFDGVRFEVFDRDTTQEFKSSHIGALVPDPDGALWIGTRQGLGRLEDGRLVGYTSEDGLAGNDVRALYRNRQGYLWIGTGSGFSRFAEGVFTTYTTRDGLIHDSVWSILEDRQGRLWIGTEGGLSRLEGGSFSFYGHRQGLSHEHVQALYEDRQGRLWIGTLEGLYRFEDERPIAYDLPDGRPRPWVYSFHEDRAGDLWIGTDDGLKRLRNGVFTSYRREDGLPDDEVRAVLQDHEGSLWFGTRHGGLGRLRKSKFAVFGTPEGLADDVVWAILQTRKGDVWIGTNDGLTHLATDGTISNYSTRDGLPGTDVRALYEDRHGYLWIGTYAHGLARWRDGEFRVYTSRDGLAAAGVLGIEEDRQGRLWIATDGGGLNWLEDGELGTYSTQDGLPHDTVKGIYKDRRGVLWFGTEGGIARYEDGVFTTLSRRDGLADDRVRSFYQDADGSLWIGTREAGMSRLQDGKISHLSVEDGLYDHGVHRIMEDGQGRLWMTSNKGIFQVSRRQLDDFASGRIRAFASVSYSESDGLRSSECNGGTNPAGWRTRDGRLWFPTIQGVAILDPDDLEINQVPPPVHIEDVLVDKGPIDLRAATRTAAGQVELPAGIRELEFRYTALSFVAPEKIRFKYKLEGFDQDWGDAGSRRSAFYTNLDPGSYRFRVIASNSDGVWNETGDSFQIYLRPAFHQTWYFYAACALALAGLGRGAHRFRVRQLLSHNEELRQMKRQLEAKNTEVEAKNAEAETRSAELERFTYTVSHDLKSPLITIRGFLGLLAKDAMAGKLERIQADVERIDAAAEKMNRLLEELLELSRIGRLMNEPEEVAMGELAEEAVQLVAGQLAERGIAVEIAPDMPAVVVDRQRLVEVLQNLLDNAAKFIDDQSSPHIVIGCRRRDGGDRQAEPPVFYVRDNGRGIDPRYHEKIFGLFERLETDTKGTGIGLALVQRIIEVHGGRIWVESEGRGKGSTFCFTLPRKRAVEDPSAVSS